jgi:hypothetical protein
VDYARLLKDLSDTRFPQAWKIVLVQDNLNTHKPASLHEAFPAAAARRLVERFQWHCTPKQRCSTSRNPTMPPSDDSRAPSNLAITVLPQTLLPQTGDRPGGGSIGSVIAGVVSRKLRRLGSTTKSYVKSVI